MKDLVFTSDNSTTTLRTSIRNTLSTLNDLRRGNDKDKKDQPIKNLVVNIALLDADDRVFLSEWYDSGHKKIYMRDLFRKIVNSSLYLDYIVVKASYREVRKIDFTFPFIHKMDYITAYVKNPEQI